MFVQGYLLWGQAVATACLLGGVCVGVTAQQVLPYGSPASRLHSISRQLWNQGATAVRGGSMLLCVCGGGVCWCFVVLCSRWQQGVAAAGCIGGMRVYGKEVFC